MKEKPLISVIIPVYNVEKYLSRSVESVLNQNYKKLEIILINDGSTDSSPTICDDYQKIDDRIVVIHKKNEGASSTRNKGIEVCRGEYICFLDADDWMDVEALEVGINTLLEHSVDMVFWSRIKEYHTRSVKEESTFTENQLFDKSAKRQLHIRMVGLLNQELAKPTKTDAFNPVWGKIYASEIIKSNKIAFINTKVIGSEDVAFNIEYMCFAKSAFYIHKYFSHYWKENELSLTKNQKNTLFPRFKNLFSNTKQVLEQNNLFDEENEQALNNRIVCSVINCGLAIVGDHNSQNFLEKYNSFKEIVKDPVYSKALTKFDLKYLPRHFKVLFWLMKNKFLFFSFSMFFAMKRLREK